MSPKKIIQYAAGLTVFILLVGLGGWYFFLNKQGQDIATTDAGRGLGSAPPSFEGDTGSNYSNVSETGTAPSAGGEKKAPPRLWHVTKTPVAGMGFVDRETTSPTSATTSSSFLYFAERGTGYILKADASTGVLTRLTNTLFPRVYEAAFDTLGSVVLRSIDDAGNILTFAGNAPWQNTPAKTSSAAASSTALSGKYLELGIRAVAPYQKTHELLLLVPTANGGSDVVLSSWDGAKQKIIFSSPLSGWKLSSLLDGRVFLSLAPADDVAGYSFEIQNGALITRMRNVPGLTFLPQSSSEYALFGQSTGGDVSLFSSPKAGAETIYIPIKTLADKCVWAPPTISSSGKIAKATSAPLIAYCAVPDNFTSNNFLTDWYMGRIHTSDTWWRIDAGTGQVSPMLEPGDAQETFDVESPIIDSAGTMISFMDAKDKSLWLLNISAKENIEPAQATQI